MRRAVLTYIYLLVTLGVFAQQGVREEVFVHVNSTYLLAGETLYYSAFVSEYGSSKPSQLSKILYVELIGKENNRIFQHKIELENGRGYADYFVPTLVPTGSYHLVAYTRWMKNFESYFQIPITIINPFDTYDLPEKEGLSVTYSPVSGGLVYDQANSMIISITNNRQPYKTKGRIVNGEGTKVADVDSNENGEAHTILIPKENENYQLIIENSLGEFEFFKVPITPSETSIMMTTYPGFYQFTLSSNSDSELFEIYDGEMRLLQRTVSPNQPFQVSKNELKSTGPFVAQSKKASLVFGEDLPFPKAESIGQFDTRSPIKLSPQIEGNFSVSVQAINKQPTPSIKTKGESNRTHRLSSQVVEWRGLTQIPDTIYYLPELRGEIISGKVHPSFSDEIVTFSTIDSVFQLRTSVIKNNGEFNIQIEPMYENKDAFLTVLGQDSMESIIVYSNYYDTYKHLTFPEVILDSTTAYQLTTRSIRNQIENAYYELPKITPKLNTLPFQFGSTLKTYVLDDYNRFPKMYEHFVEFIPEVVARQNKSRSKIKVLMEYLLPTDLAPLIVIDGLPTTAQKVLDFSPYKIHSIDVSQNRIFLGPMVFDGLVSFHTITSDLYGFKPGSNNLEFNYQGFEPKYVYRYPEYEANNTTEADYRRQLYWNPEVNWIKEDTLQFYTSDLTGEFEIVIEGYTNSGEPTSIRKTFEVK